MAQKYAAVDRVNIRRTPQFGSNIAGSLHLNQSVVVDGEQQGDRWFSATANIDGAQIAGFVSKNVIRDPVSDKKENLLLETMTQWIRFERGKRKEYETPHYRYVGEFWQSIGMDLDGRDRDVPWSAAFISYVVRSAGGYSGFKYAAAHARYVNKAIRSKLDGADHPFWGYKITDHKPGLGDMVCRWRQTPVDYDYAATHDAFKSHCDIVVQVADDHVLTIGGNVGHSVNHTRYPINGAGYLTGGGNVYAVLKNTR